jgi:hypothetical protein
MGGVQGVARASFPTKKASKLWLDRGAVAGELMSLAGAC